MNIKHVAFLLCATSTCSAFTPESSMEKLSYALGYELGSLIRISQQQENIIAKDFVAGFSDCVSELTLKYPRAEVQKLITTPDFSDRKKFSYSTGCGFANRISISGADFRVRFFEQAVADGIYDLKSQISPAEIRSLVAVATKPTSTDEEATGSAHPLENTGWSVVCYHKYSVKREVRRDTPSAYVEFHHRYYFHKVLGQSDDWVDLQADIQLKRASLPTIYQSHPPPDGYFTAHSTEMNQEGATIRLLRSEDDPSIWKLERSPQDRTGGKPWSMSQLAYSSKKRSVSFLPQSNIRRNPNGRMPWYCERVMTVQN